MKTPDGKDIKIEFAPGAFDQFEGTQEELDALQKEIMEMLEAMTPEELAEESIAVDEEYIEQMMDDDPEWAESLVKALSSDPADPKRNLQ